MTIRFDDRVIIITGACGSLGREFAHAYYERGARLLLSDLGAAMSGEAENKSAVETFAKSLDPTGERVLFDSSDIADPDAGATIADMAISAFGRIDVVVNGAGNMRNHAFKQMSREDFENVVNVHLLGAAYLTLAAFPHMLEQNYGRILMVTSAGGLYGAFGVGNYGAAKTALIGLMNVLKIEGARHNVLTNAIAPIASSRMIDGLFEEDPGDMTSPKWITPPALYLTSDRCNSAGDIIVAAGAHYAKAQIVESRGVNAPAGEGYPTPEYIESNFASITDMSDAAPLANLGAAMRKAFDAKIAV